MNVQFNIDCNATAPLMLANFHGLQSNNVLRMAATGRSKIRTFRIIDSANEVISYKVSEFDKINLHVTNQTMMLLLYIFGDVKFIEFVASRLPSIPILAFCVDYPHNYQTIAYRAWRNAQTHVPKNVFFIENSCYDKSNVLKYLNLVFKNIDTTHVFVENLFVNNAFMSGSFNDAPRNKILLSGNLCGEQYPCRVQFKQYCLNNPDKCDILSHDVVTRHTYNQFEYANKLSEYIAAYAGPVNWVGELRNKGYNEQNFNDYYPTVKFFEIPATGCLLFANRIVEAALNRCGFFDKVNCILTTPDTFDEDVNYVLDLSNREQINEMRRKGQQHVLSNYTETIFSKRLIDIFNTVCDIHKSSN